ncbi:HigA family addiction module antitoxin [Castellaniella denitrificans]|jgi:addiction module HigA family antidote|uniref:HigA family addiction module antitoxin n=1 Tax=Castellaniella denitrificans TaxID=56119 RepID=UPI001AC19C8C|nr:HigA family addiction module antidote protein [Burkholderiales bacterium]
MRNTKRRPVTVGQMLTSEFLEPLGIGLNTLADAMGVHRNTLSRIVHDKGTLTAPMAIKLAAALGNTPEFWLNIQHAVELWDVRHRAYEREAKSVKPIIANASLRIPASRATA